MAFPSGWGRKQKITIQSSEVSGSGSYANFPVLVTLNHLNAEIVDDGSNSALNGGGDIRFSSDNAGTTQLACEMVEFVVSATPGLRKVTLWVKVASISTSANTDIYIWYDKIGESQPIVSDTYGRNSVWTDYPFVSHDGGETDSTGNTTSTEIGTPTNTTGPFGTSDGARDWSAKTTNQGYTASISNYNSFTLQAWAQPQGSIGDALIVGLGNPSFTEYVIISSTTFNDDYAVYSTDSNEFLNVVGETLNSWSSLSMTLEDGVGGACFIDGVSASTNALFNSSATGKTLLTCGYTGLGAQNWEGLIAEVRLRDAVLSGGWVTTEYTNQNTPADFAVAGTPEIAVGDTLLVISGDSIDHTGDSVTLTQEQMLTVDEAGHGHVCDAMVLSENIALLLNDGLSGHQCENLIIDPLLELTINVTVHGVLSDQMILSGNHVLFSADALNNTLSDVVTFETVSELEVQSSDHALLNSGLALGYSVNMIVADNESEHFADRLLISQNHVMVVVQSGHDLLSGNVDIGLSVSSEDANHMMISDQPSLLQLNQLLLENAFHTHSTEEPYVRLPAGIWGQVGEATSIWSNRAPQPANWNEKNQSIDEWTEE